MDLPMMDQGHIPIGINYKDIIIQVAVPADLAFRCTNLISSFSNELSLEPEGSDSIDSSIELFACFLKYCTVHGKDLVECVFRIFESRFLNGKDIHVVCAELDLSKDQICTVLCGYFSAWIIVSTNISPPKLPALFSNDSVKLMALFGGQSGSGSYFDELSFIFKAYKPLVIDLIERMSSFLAHAVSDPQFESLYEYGLDFRRWLINSEIIPPFDYLISSPVSIPLTGVVHLLQYFITFKTFKIAPDELAKLFEVAIGHSHGIIPATVISCSTTEASFYENSEKALGIQLIFATFGQLEYPFNPIVSEPDGEVIYPMASIKGIKFDSLSSIVKDFNDRYRHKHLAVYISVINTSANFIISGELLSVKAFVDLFRSVYIPYNRDRTDLSCSQSEPIVSIEYTRITILPHCMLYANTIDKQYQYAVEKGWMFNSKDMQITVRANDDGHDIREETDLTRYLILSNMVLPVNWPIAIDHRGITHIIDFGPGGINGFGALAYKNIEGRGISIICASTAKSERSEFGIRADLYKYDTSSINKEISWAERYSPTIVHTESDDSIHISTKMSRILGKPPFIVEGISLATISEDLATVATNFGYHIELVCGNIYDKNDFESKISRLIDSIDPGCSITLTCNLNNPEQWSFQFSAIVDLRRNGVPIEGLCISGDVPPLDTATEIIDIIKDTGIHHISFNPQSIDSISRVIKIAKKSSNFSIIIQWTGEYNTSNNSFEDFCKPILIMYSSIRKQENIILVVGSVSGSIDDVFNYLTGEWSVQFNCPPMPFDGFLIGSQMMATKESKAAECIKEFIATSPGITIIKSEDGRPIHTITNRCSILWEELDNTVFSVPSKDRLKIVLEKKDYIINHLNRDYIRPWFGILQDGRAADIDDMTYMEVIKRLAALLFNEKESRWVHQSYRRIFNSFLLRIEQQFSSIYDYKQYAIYGEADLNKEIGQLARKYPDIATQLITSQDIKYLIELCKSCTQYPVPFIPILDDDFEIWFKKGVIWQFEELGCIPDQNPQRVIIVQWPGIVQGTTSMNVPVIDIINGFYYKLVDRIFESKYNDNPDGIDTLGFLADLVSADTTDLISNGIITKTVSDIEHIYIFSENDSSLPDDSTWTCMISGGKLNWIYNLMVSPFITDNKRLVNNTVRTILRLRANHTVRISLTDGIPITVSISDKQGLAAVYISIEELQTVNIFIYSHLNSGTSVLHHQLQYDPTHSFSPFIRLSKECNQSSIQFLKDCTRLGSSKGRCLPDIITGPLSASFNSYYISSHQVIEYLKVIGQTETIYKNCCGNEYFVPADYIAELALQTSLSCAMQGSYGDNILNMVQQSCIIKMLSKYRPLCTGDTININSNIESATNVDSGKRIQIKSHVIRDEEVVVEIVSTFLVRGTPLGVGDLFSSGNKLFFKISLKTESDILVLRSKEWFIANIKTIDNIQPGSSLTFILDTHYRYKTTNIYSSASVIGKVLLLSSNNTSVHVGDIKYFGNTLLKDPVISYLDRFMECDGSPVYFDNGGYPLFIGKLEDNGFTTAPGNNSKYGSITGNHSPIHTNIYLADYLELPPSIIYGMNASALMRSYVDIYAADGHPERVVKWSIDFLKMILPWDKLVPRFNHTGMRDGRMLIKGTAVNQHNDIVMSFAAEIEQSPIAYIFTGQGHQYTKMGMELYENSIAAKTVWDQGNSYMFKTYGIPILDFVQTNPTKYTIYFDGNKGATIRKNYERLAPGFIPPGRQYSFSLSKGLLHLIPFTQPALVLFMLATIVNMKEKGILQYSSIFAGHSFGEFPALCAIGEIFSIEDTLDIVFCRGLLMHQMIKGCDIEVPKYGMVVVDPSRVSANFIEEDLISIIHSIKENNDDLLEIANYNMFRKQYVVSGTIQQLRILSIILDELSRARKRTSRPLEDIVKSAMMQTIKEKTDSGKIVLKHGVSTVPLSEIYVPSHSSFFLSIVEPLRQCIKEKLESVYIDYNRLCRQYIPNLIGKPFELSKTYLEMVYNLTESAAIKGIIDGWDSIDQVVAEKQQWAIKTLLVELLAHQFAYPVQWISTQDHMFTKARVERIIEIGPSSILSAMAKQSAFTYSSHIEALSIETDADLIYYHSKKYASTKGLCKGGFLKQSEQNRHNSQSTPKIDHSQDQEKILTSTPAQTSIPNTATQSAVILPDVPLNPLFVIKIIVAQKLKKRISAIPDSKSIGSLSKGKSTLQNDILGNLKREFCSSIFDVPEELSLEELALKLLAFTGTLGDYTMSQISRLFRSKLPGGFSQTTASDYLKSEYRLGPQSCDAVLLLTLTAEPPERLSNSADAESWLDRIVHEYADINGIVIQKHSATNTNTGDNDFSDIAVAHKMEKAQLNQNPLSKILIEAYTKDVAENTNSDIQNYENIRSERDALQKSLNRLNCEFGSELIVGVEPIFNPLKARRFDSYWNWVRQDAVVLIREAFSKIIDISSTETKMKFHMIRERSTPALIEYIGFCVEQLEHRKELNTMDPNIKIIKKLHQDCKNALHTPPAYTVHLIPKRPHTSINENHNVVYSEVPDPNISTCEAYIEKMRSDYGDGRPLVYIKTSKEDSTWEYNPLLTGLYLDNLSAIYSKGVTFNGAHVLLTGCGKTSIGEEMLKGLLVGGAKVIATTSNYSHKSILYFEDIYKQYGSRGSELIVVPFNHGSVEDVKKLVEFIYSPPNSNINGLGWDLDFVMPFTALPSLFGDITAINSHAELSLRAMLVNIHRLLGEIVSQKINLGHSTRITRAIIPLSINHGQFGGGGLYCESKIALEALLNRWYAEPWSEYMSIACVMIGWTRGTIQAVNSSIVSEGMERLGAYTFTTAEMATFILCLLNDSLCAGDVVEPIMIDIGGRALMRNIREIMMDIRKSVIEKGYIRKCIASDLTQDSKYILNATQNYMMTQYLISPRANLKSQFPRSRSYEDLDHLHYLQGIVDLDKVVVVTGFGEVGPYGSSRTRWEVEAYGELSLEGCTELAWVMGYIKFFNDTLKSTGKKYTGWIDTTTGEPVPDVDIKAQYEKRILAHTGVRLIEPELHDGYDPNKKIFISEVQIEHDMDPFEASKEEAEQFKLKNEDKVKIWKNENGTWFVRFLKGAIIMLPKALCFDRTVAGQIPTGWNPVRYGIPKDIVNQIDPAVLYVLVSTMEALISSGITDPYEIYQYLHLNQIGTSIGSVFGGSTTYGDIFSGKTNIERDKIKDYIAEVLVSSASAWVNMLLLSSTGIIKPNSGACATGILSIDSAVEAIQLGKAKVVFAGGFEKFSDAFSYEYAQLGATIGTADEVSRGRVLSEMSRPCTSTRDGFIDSEGASVAVLMSASVAIEMGVPIYGIIASSRTAMDKVSRTSTTPGQGILTTAMESPQGLDSSLLDISHRQKKLDYHLEQIERLVTDNSDNIMIDSDGNSRHRKYEIEMMRKELQSMWGNNFWKHIPNISQLRGSLAIWGLDTDDIGVASFHGTSTVQNDLNESEVFNTQFKHLRRTPGNIVPVITQKWLTGHSKGAASLWMLNGMLRVLDTGIVPGNRNADNIDRKLEQFEYLVYPSKSIQYHGIKAGLLKGFGFGQVGGELLVVHPDYILASLSRDKFDKYQKKLKDREKKVYRYWNDTLVGNHTFVQVKDNPPYTKDQEHNIYLDPDARARYDPKTKQYHF